MLPCFYFFFLVPLLVDSSSVHTEKIYHSSKPINNSRSVDTCCVAFTCARFGSLPDCSYGVVFKINFTRRVRAALFLLLCFPPCSWLITDQCTLKKSIIPQNPEN